MTSRPLVPALLIFTACGMQSQGTTASVDFPQPVAERARRGEVVLNRYGRGGDLPVTFISTKDHTGRAIGSDYDVAVELRAFIARPSGLSESQALAKLSMVMRDVEGWVEARQNGTGAPLYESVVRTDREGRPVSAPQYATPVLGNQVEESFSDVVSRQLVATTRIRVRSLLSGTIEGGLASTLENVSPVRTSVLGASVDLSAPGGMRNHAEFIPAENGFLFYSVGSLKASSALARPLLNTDLVEAGLVGSFVRFRDELARTR